MNRPDLIDHLEGLKAGLERIDQDEPTAMRFALVHCVRALRYCKDADGLTPTRRKEVKSAYRMAAAAAGMDHD